jgi:hypothetical protein
MSEVATATAAVLRDLGAYILVTGRATPALEPLIAGARRHVLSSGPGTRLAVAAGTALGGHPAIAVVDEGCAFDDGHGEIAVTEAPAAAARALRSGWSVVQPSSGADVAALLRGAPRPALVLLPADAPDARTGTGAPDDPPHDPPDDPPPDPPSRGLRVWRDGGLATVVASGAAVGPMVRIGERLAARGVSVTAVEVAVLAGPAHAALLGGDALHVGPPGSGDEVVRGTWPRALARVPLSGAEDADLIGLVLSHIRTG